MSAPSSSRSSATAISRRSRATGWNTASSPGKACGRGGDYRKPAAPCAGVVPGAAQPPPACAAFLAGSEKAALQWEFEAQIADYEDAVLAGRFARP